MEGYLVPTPLAALLSNSVSIGAIRIAPEQLTQSEFVATLPWATRRAATKVAVRRIVQDARHMASLRQRAVLSDIRVPDDFDSQRLTRRARAVFQRLFNGHGWRSLDQWTWGQLLDNRRTGIQRVTLMSAMAELEWRVVDASASAAPETAVSPLTGATLEGLLADGRINHIRANDLRYGWGHFGEHAELCDLIKEWLSSNSGLSAAQQRFTQRLQRGLAMTLAEDIEDIGQALATAQFGTITARSRAAEVFAARYGARDYGPHLEAIGKRQGCSGTRVSQLDGQLLKALDSYSLASPAAITMLTTIESLAFLESPQLETAAGLVPGHGHSLQTFRRFCLAVLRPAIGFDIAQQQVLSHERQGIASDFSRVSRFTALLRHARRQANIAGAVNITSVAGYLALDSDERMTRQQLERWVDELPEAHWLDRDGGWFALEDLANSLIYPRVRKILAVAQKPVSVREIGEALWRDAKLADESKGESAIVPMNILKKTVLAWPDGIQEDPRGNLFAGKVIDPEAALSPLEFRIYSAIAERGGVATSMSILKAVGGEPAIRATLAYAVFAYPVGNGVYGLRGWRVGQHELLAALVNKVSERGAESGSSGQPVVMVVRSH